MPAMAPSDLAPPFPSEVTTVESADAEGAAVEDEGFDFTVDGAMVEGALTVREGFEDAVDGDIAVGAGFGIA